MIVELDAGLAGLLTISFVKKCFTGFYENILNYPHSFGEFM